MDRGIAFSGPFSFWFCITLLWLFWLFRFIYRIFRFPVRGFAGSKSAGGRQRRKATVSHAGRAQGTACIDRGAIHLIHVFLRSALKIRLPEYVWVSYSFVRQ